MTENSAGRERWEVDADPRPHTRWGMNLQVLDAEAGTTVCFVANSSRGADSEARGQENYRRAHLIAAAPELYAACREAAERFREYERIHEAKGNAEKAASNVAMAASLESILLRARGESPEVKP